MFILGMKLGGEKKNKVYKGESSRLFCCLETMTFVIWSGDHHLVGRCGKFYNTSRNEIGSSDMKYGW